MATRTDSIIESIQAALRELQKKSDVATSDEAVSALRQVEVDVWAIIDGYVDESWALSGDGSRPPTPLDI